MRPINEIIVHCAATRPNWMAGRPLAKGAIDALGFGTVEASDAAWTAAGGVPVAIAVGVMW